MWVDESKTLMQLKREGRLCSDCHYGPVTPAGWGHPADIPRKTAHL